MATVVVADDDDDLRAVYVAALSAAGHRVYEASDGNVTLSLVRSRRPDLLLLDIWMPGKTGFDVLEDLRHDPAGSYLKVVVVSNLGDADSRLNAFEAGATAYMVKGKSLAELVDLVGATLGEAPEGLDFHSLRSV